MRSLKYLGMLSAVALSISVSAFAHPKNEHSMTISDNVQVGSTQLKAGTYKIEWQGPASSLQVRFIRDGKTVATAQARMVEKDKAFPSDEIVTADMHKTQRLEEIDFGGKKDALVFPTVQTTMK